MNFETQQSFEQQLGQLLAFIVLFEKQIEALRQKLAGNQEFHTRLIFQRLDINKRGQVRAQDIVYSIGEMDKKISLKDCQSFCRKHSISGALSYDELLVIVVPKNHKILSQRLLVRTAKRGATLPDYLWKNFRQMLKLMIQLTRVAQNIRSKIQNSSNNLSHLDMVYFFKTCLLNLDKLWNFCHINAAGEYSFEAQDGLYLSNHIRSGNPIQDMTDEDIKQIICPLDMNFQKTEKQMGLYYQTLKNQKMRSQKGFYQLSQKQKNQNTPINFLNVKYNRTFSSNFMQNTNPNFSYKKKPQSNFNHDFYENTQEFKPQPLNHPLKPTIDYDNMYLGNFMKPSNAPSFRQSKVIQLDQFLINQSGQQYQRDSRKGGYIAPYQRFQDDLQNNYGVNSQQQDESAFDAY